MDATELTEMCHALDKRLIAIETELSLRKTRETNMPGWIWGGISAITAVFMALFWWLASGGSGP